ncbi:hypothetical protein QEJ31_15275 [Pigmentibacter sp. JX0631]|uniref:hypothetical protein n=1 Tax=Pigmentibacter sp. JX0631 TaxID=2976982 RepID=UPI0024697166|nr:hypothetical protein [Pigmentibacter sp. JX0631]WGL59892.1 hypothetical protein QEJ31_15275 [Pigmentibacter sp. JX0631]
MCFLQFIVRKMKVKWTILVLFTVSFSAFANEEVYEYTVQPNDNLSTVLQKLSLKPIYGKNGSLAEVLKLNPDKQESNGNCIYVGEVIILPKSMLTKQNQSSEIKTEVAKKNEIKKPNNNNNVVISQQPKEPKIPLQKSEKIVTQQPKEPKIPLQKSEKIVSQQPKEPKIPLPKSEKIVTQQPKEPKIPLQINEKIVTQQPLSVPEKKLTSTEIKKIEPGQTLASENLHLEKKSQIVSPSENENKKSFNKLNEIFSSNSKLSFSKQISKNNLEFDNKSKIENQLFPSQKTILLALPLKKQDINREDTLSSSNSKNSSTTNLLSRKEVFLSEENSCDIFPSCKFWLWDLNNKCCLPKKPYFMISNENSLK